MFCLRMICAKTIGRVTVVTVAEKVIGILFIKRVSATYTEWWGSSVRTLPVSFQSLLLNVKGKMVSFFFQLKRSNLLRKMHLMKYIQKSSRIPLRRAALNLSLTVENKLVFKGEDNLRGTVVYFSTSSEPSTLGNASIYVNADFSLAWLNNWMPLGVTPKRRKPPFRMCENLCSL